MDEIYSNIRKTQNYLMFTPGMTNMKLLQLRKLTELSGNLDAKLYLMQNFIPNAKVIMANQSSDYAKDKILNIIASICHIDKAIEMIGKDSEFVRIILRSFDTCGNNIRLQITLFKLLQLIACEIQSNPKSNWTLYLTNSSYFFAPNIIAILKNTETEKVMLDGIAMLHTLFDVQLTDGTSFLERLFNVNELIDIMIKGQIYLQNEACWFCCGVCSMKKEAAISTRAILEMCVSITITIIRYLKLFKRAPCEFENDIQCLYMLHKILHLQDRICATFCISMIRGYSKGNEKYLEVESTMEIFFRTFVTIMDLVLSFPINVTGYIKVITNMLNIIDVYIMDNYLPQYQSRTDLSRYYIEHTEIMENISPVLRTIIQYVDKYVERFLSTAKFKQLLEEVMRIPSYERRFVLDGFEEHRNVRKLQRKIERCCKYVYN